MFLLRFFSIPERDNYQDYFINDILMIRKKSRYRKTHQEVRALQWHRIYPKPAYTVKFVENIAILILNNIIIR